MAVGIVDKIPATTILVAETGSGAYGTGIIGVEDRDLMGVVVETLPQVLGQPLKNVMHRTAPEGERSGPNDIDLSLYSLRTFLNLAKQGNPSILAALYCPRQPDLESQYYSWFGDELTRISDAFVSRAIIPRYRGYMRSQMLRLLGLKGGKHGTSGNRPELVEKYGYDTKFAMHAVRLGYQCLELLQNGELKIPIPAPTGDRLRAIRHGGVEFQDFFDEAIRLDTEMGDLYDRDDIPPGPDEDRIMAFSIDTHINIWGYE